MSVASLVASALATAPSPPGASPTRCVVISSDWSRAVAVSAGQPGARRDRRKRTIPTMMAATARPTSSHGHHVVPVLSPAGAVVVAGAPVGRRRRVVAGASVRGGSGGASVRGGSVAGASVAGRRLGRRRLRRRASARRRGRGDLGRSGHPRRHGAGPAAGTRARRSEDRDGDSQRGEPGPERAHRHIIAHAVGPVGTVAGAGPLTSSRAGRDANVGGVLARSPSARPTRRARPRTGGRAARPRHRARPR